MTESSTDPTKGRSAVVEGLAGLAWGIRRSFAVLPLAILIAIGALATLPWLEELGTGIQTPRDWWLDVFPLGPVTGAWVAARSMLRDQRLWAIRSERGARFGAWFQLVAGALWGSLAIALGSGWGDSPPWGENLLGVGVTWLWIALRTGTLAALMVGLIRRPLVLPIVLWMLPHGLARLSELGQGSLSERAWTAWLAWPSGPLPGHTIMFSGAGFLILLGWWLLQVSAHRSSASHVPAFAKLSACSPQDGATQNSCDTES